MGNMTLMTAHQPIGNVGWTRIRIKDCFFFYCYYLLLLKITVILLFCFFVLDLVVSAWSFAYLQFAGSILLSIKGWGHFKNVKVTCDIYIWWGDQLIMDILAHNYIKVISRRAYIVIKICCYLDFASYVCRIVMLIY